MRLLIATDACFPQINGVVRCIAMWAEAAERRGVSVILITSDGFPTIPLPTYSSIRIALPRKEVISDMISQVRPDAIHIATEGPVGFAVRRYCIGLGRRFTTYFHTRFPDYVTARFPIPQTWIWKYLRQFHRPSSLVMVGTQALAGELIHLGFSNVVVAPPGVDTDFFHPRLRVDLELQHPIFLSSGRLAPEKNTAAFLKLDLPGTKIVIGDGPQKASLVRKYRDALFFGAIADLDLARFYASADVFVFPSRTDTFGLVMLEALASGLPIAASGSQASREMVRGENIGAIEENLGSACMKAIHMSRRACREAALDHTWDRSARRFLDYAITS
jgi:glycosyltransferase involved in cell wall biosynthesis